MDRIRRMIMNPVIIAAILGIIGTVSAPIITLHYKRHIDEKFIPSIRSERIRAVVGDWRGTYSITDEDGTKKRIELDARIWQERKKLVGIGTFIDGEIKVDLEGWHLDDSFIKFDYRDKRLHVVRFGSTIVKLNANGDELNGYYLGYRPDEEKIVSGVVKLKKR